MAVFGMWAIMQPCVVMPAGLPFIGDLMSGLMGCGVFLVAVVAGSSIVSAWIAIAWLHARPAVSVALLVAAAGGLFLIWRKNRTAVLQKKEEERAKSARGKADKAHKGEGDEKKED